MRAYILAAALFAAMIAMPAQADAGPDICSTAAGDAIESATGTCGGTVEPWMCLGGSGSHRDVDAGPYKVRLNICSPPPGTIPPVG